MIPYFSDDVIWDKYYAELVSWIGTPYRHLQMVKGKGADCTLFIGATWLRMGILTKVAHDYYSRDWYNHEPSELVLDSLHHHFMNFASPGIVIRKVVDKTDPAKRTLNISDLMRGDVPTFAANRTGITNHAGVFLPNGDMIHSYNSARRGVTRSQFGKHGQFWHDHLTYVFRVMKEE